MDPMTIFTVSLVVFFISTILVAFNFVRLARKVFDLKAHSFEHRFQAFGRGLSVHVLLGVLMLLSGLSAGASYVWIVMG